MSGEADRLREEVESFAASPYDHALDVEGLIEAADRLDALEVARCATCRFWDQHDDLPTGKCERIEDHAGVSPWPPQPEIRSGPDDGFAFLWVPASFGCTLHEPVAPLREEHP